MIKTQIQLPDELYRSAKSLAERQEWSLAETMRRGLEALLARYPEAPNKDWQLPEPRPLGGDGFFRQPDWRFQVNQPLVVNEKAPPYKTRRRKRA